VRMWRHRAGSAPARQRIQLVPAAALAVAAVAASVPLGVAVGRLVWAQVASGSGVAGDVLVPGGLLAATAVVVGVAAAVLALLPAARAARLSPAAQLRAE
jgi:putative ABC transport system permease protein